VDLEPVGTVGHRLARVERGGRDAGLLAGLQQRHTARVLRGNGADVHRTAATVVVTGGVVGLQALVQREDVLGSPAGATDRLPLVEVLGGSPEGDAGVVRGAAAEDRKSTRLNSSNVK